MMKFQNSSWKHCKLMLWTDRWSKSTIQPPPDRIGLGSSNPILRIGFLVMELFDGNISRGNLLEKKSPQTKELKENHHEFHCFGIIGKHSETTRAPKLVQPETHHFAWGIVGKSTTKTQLKAVGDESLLYAIVSKWRNGAIHPFFIHPFFVWYECHQGFWRSAKIWFTFTLQPMSYSTPR